MADVSVNHSGGNDFFQKLYHCIDDLAGLEERMVRMEEAFSQKAAEAYFADRLQL